MALLLPLSGEIYQSRHLLFWSVSDAARGISLQGFLSDTAGRGVDRVLHRTVLTAILVEGLELARSATIAFEQTKPWESIRMTLGVFFGLTLKR